MARKNHKKVMFFGGNQEPQPFNNKRQMPTGTFFGLYHSKLRPEVCAFAGAHVALVDETVAILKDHLPGEKIPLPVHVTGNTIFEALLNFVVNNMAKFKKAVSRGKASRLLDAIEEVCAAFRRTLVVVDLSSDKKELVHS